MADTPPRRRRPAPDPAEAQEEMGAPREEATKPPPPPASAPGKPPKVLQSKLTNFFVGMSLPFAAAGDTHCAAVLVERGPVVAEAWANLAAESPAVKRVLDSMLRGSAWAGAISSTVALVVPIAAHHGAPIPDPVSAIILGKKPEPEREPIVTPPPQGNAEGVPGPAAVSTLRANGNTGGFDPADSTQYPGINPAA